MLLLGPLGPSPYNPELNPMEQVFQYRTANRFANHVFATMDAVREAREVPWKWLCQTSERIASILHGGRVTATARLRDCTLTKFISRVWIGITSSGAQPASAAAWRSCRCAAGEPWPAAAPV